MTHVHRYPPNVPCWVDALNPDLAAARRFYAGLFGWEYDGPHALSGGRPGEYWLAQIGGVAVAGLGSLPAPEVPSSWTTYVSVDDAGAASARAEAAGASVLLEPGDAPDAGRVAVLADPAGVAFGLWEPRERIGAQLINAPSAWAMSRLDTPDPDGAAAFYAAAFGWRAEPFGEGPGLWLLRLPGYVGGEPEQPVPRDVVAVMMDTRIHAAPAAWSVDFWIADADAAAAAAPGLGGSVIVEPFDVMEFRQTVLAAPGGATFSVSQLTRPG